VNVDNVGPIACNAVAMQNSGSLQYDGHAVLLDIGLHSAVSNFKLLVFRL